MLVLVGKECVERRESKRSQHQLLGQVRRGTGESRTPEEGGGGGEGGEDEHQLPEFCH